MNYSEYSPDWKDIIRPAILKRDNYKCQVCGVRHKSKVYKDSRQNYVECDAFVEQWAISTGRKVFVLYLQVAHLDHNKSNNDPLNLRTLCPRHHALYDKQNKAFQRKIYRAKITVNQAKTVETVLSEYSNQVTEVKKIIRKYTKTTVSTVDAENIFNSILKLINHE
jgi:hypothetical protein